MATKQIKTVGSKVHRNFGKACLKFCTYLGNLTALAGLAYKPVVVQACLPGDFGHSDKPQHPQSSTERVSANHTDTRPVFGIVTRGVRQSHFYGKAIGALQRIRLEHVVTTDMGALILQTSYHRSCREITQ
ncbi:hypothetical protein [Pseudomonas sp. BP8]|uniref:hypothetical protein n=1 Tax=Pseudomonas sp. BP8 TaxID=2817864 RepID=UPI001AE40F37|nr:hypothetical protein [Pseudomonas sp. BP8]MBP2262351.1 hypothetical protein [Pseudomonas sp. BP8]HDS1733266.1 hypothetical protein [Pseudomonas putida]